LAFGAVVALLTSCRREVEGPAPSATPPGLPASPRGPKGVTEPRTPAVVIEESGDVNNTLQKLTSALRDFVIHTRSVPKNFDEFAAKSLVSFPQPPPGKKYAIKGQEVVLVER
jgi:hypothetical protein